MSDWSGGDYVDLGPSGAIAASDYTISRFAEIGLDLPPNNRLTRARRLLVAVNDQPTILTRDDQVMLRRVTEAQWTIFDFYLIARATGGNVADDHLRKVRLALGGADLPEDDTNHLARNTAFELLVAATLTMGGVNVALDEPDVLALLGGGLIGIAAKRVQGIRSVRRRMRQAADQIRRSGSPGLIAVNADVILLGTAPIGDARTKGQAIDDELAEIHKADDELIHSTDVIGRIAFARTARWSFDGDRPVLTQDMFRQYRLYERTDGERDAMTAHLQRAERLIKQRMQEL